MEKIVLVLSILFVGLINTTQSHRLGRDSSGSDPYLTKESSYQLDTDGDINRHIISFHQAKRAIVKRVKRNGWFVNPPEYKGQSTTSTTTPPPPQTPPQTPPIPTTTTPKPCRSSWLFKKC